MNNKNKFAVLAFSLCTAFSSTSSTTDIQTCLLIENADKRLACFDKVAKSQQKQVEVIVEEKEAKPNSELSTKEPITKIESPVEAEPLDKPEVVEAHQKTQMQKEQEFGSERIASEQEKQKAESINLRVSSVKKSMHGQLTITFDNGQKWKQTDDTRFTIKAGDDVKITKGVLSSYLLRKVGKNKSIRVKRLK